MTKCKTCEFIKYMNSLNSEICDTKLYVKICEYRWSKGERKVRGRQKGEYTSKVYDLNHCPTCGIKINDIMISK